MGKDRKTVISTDGVELLNDWLMGRELSLSFDGEHKAEKTCRLIGMAFRMTSMFHPDDYKMLHALTLVIGSDERNEKINRYIHNHLPPEMKVTGIEDSLRTVILDFMANYKEQPMTDEEVRVMKEWCNAMAKKSGDLSRELFCDLILLIDAMSSVGAEATYGNALIAMQKVSLHTKEPIGETMSIAAGYKKGMKAAKDHSFEGRFLTEEEFEDLESCFEYDDSDWN